MKILYLSLSYVPSRRASSVQVMHMCAALAGLGHDVTLVCKRPADDLGAGDDHAFYGVPPAFAIAKVARPRRRGGGLVYAAGMARRVLSAGDALVYCRDLVGAAFAVQLGRRVVLEAHSVPAGWQRRLWQRVIAARSLVGLVVISRALRDDLADAGLLPRAPVVIAHDACDVAPTARVRTSVGTPPVIGYVGGIYPGRGIELLVELARRMPAARFELVGGSDADVARVRAMAPPNLVLHGFVAPARLGEFYARFDVVLMPYARHGIRGPTAKADTSRWCSPMKMFEYMAAGVPIVSSDLPVLQEVLTDGRNALIAPADDAAAWQAAIARLVAEPGLGARLAATAQADVRAHYTWDARARAILGAIA